MYGKELRGCASKSIMQYIQNQQNKIIRGIFNTLWVVRNEDLNIETVMSEMKRFARKCSTRLQQQQHTGVEMQQLLEETTQQQIGRLKIKILKFVPVKCVI